MSLRGTAWRIVRWPLRILLAIVAIGTVALSAMAGLSYAMTRGEFDNRALHADAETCVEVAVPDPKANDPDLPEYSADPEVQRRITRVRYRTMEHFARYAAMIQNTYSSAGPDLPMDATIATFDYKPRFLSPIDDAISWIDRVALGDLTADVYYGREEAGFLDVYVGFEGTSWSEWGDVLTNFAWFFAFAGRNELDDARDIFEQVRDAAMVEAGSEGRTVRFVALGHSLGGALAQHIAFGFPCVSAVVLDASFVVETHSFTAPFPAPNIVHLGDRGDVFTLLRERQKLDDFPSMLVRLAGMPFHGFMPGERTRFYTINAADLSEPASFLDVVLAQHSTENYVGTMLDMYLDYDWWSGNADFAPFRLRCLSRVAGSMSPAQCAASWACTLNDEKRAGLGKPTFAQMCRTRIVPALGQDFAMDGSLSSSN